MNKMTVVDGWVNCEVGLHFFSEALFSKQLRKSSTSGGASSPRSAGDPDKFVDKALPSVTLLQMVACICNNAIAIQPLEAPEHLLKLDDDDEDNERQNILRRSRKDQPASLFSGNPSEVALLNFFEGFRPGSELGVFLCLVFVDGRLQVS